MTFLCFRVQAAAEQSAASAAGRSADELDVVDEYLGGIMCYIGVVLVLILACSEVPFKSNHLALAEIA